jgi:hypothetical protein
MSLPGGLPATAVADEGLARIVSFTGVVEACVAVASPLADARMTTCNGSFPQPALGMTSGGAYRWCRISALPSGSWKYA